MRRHREHIRRNQTSVGYDDAKVRMHVLNTLRNLGTLESCGFQELHTGLGSDVRDRGGVHGLAAATASSRWTRHDESNLVG